MNPHANERFWEVFRALPPHVQRRARRAYRTFRADPSHPSLQFKQVHPRRPIFSVRVGLGYRAIGVREGEDILWFWVGTHGEYDQLLSRMRRANNGLQPARSPRG